MGSARGTEHKALGRQLVSAGHWEQKGAILCTICADRVVFYSIETPSKLPIRTAQYERGACYSCQVPCSGLCFRLGMKFGGPVSAKSRAERILGAPYEPNSLLATIVALDNFLFRTGMRVGFLGGVLGSHCRERTIPTGNFRSTELVEAFAASSAPFGGPV